MRELEFLPSWYPQLRERKRLVRLQAYMTVLLAFGLCSWVYLVHRNIRTASASLADVERELQQSRGELGQLDDQLQQKNQLLLQRRIVDRLGLPVEMSRMLATLDEKMPRQVSLVDCSVETLEQIKAINTVAAARTAAQGDGVERHLQVRLQGVAPSDAEVASFLAGLTDVSFFDQVSMSYSRDRAQDGHVMREFEITFSLDLNQSAGSAVASAGRSGS